MSNTNKECAILSGEMRHKSTLHRIEYTWVIENFMSYHNLSLTSPTFPSENNSYNWFLQLKTGIARRGDPYSDSSFIDVTLKPATADGEFRKYGQISGNLNIAFLNAKGIRNQSCELSFHLLNEQSCVEITKYIKRQHLNDLALLPNGELRLHCTISYILINDIAKVSCSITPIGLPEFDTIHCENYFNNEECSDIDIYVGDKKYPAHKFILAARSPVFKAMFTHDDLKENQQNRIDIKDIDEKTFEQMLRYIYTGKVDHSSSVSFELLLVADKYNLENLKVRCQFEIAKMLSTETAVKTLLYSNRHDLSDLKKRSIDYIKTHKVQLKKYKHWEDLLSCQDLLIDLLDACVSN